MAKRSLLSRCPSYL